MNGSLHLGHLDLGHHFMQMAAYFLVMNSKKCKFSSFRTSHEISNRELFSSLFVLSHLKCLEFNKAIATRLPFFDT